LKVGIYLAGQDIDCIIPMFTEELHRKRVGSSSHLYTLCT